MNLRVILFLLAVVVLILCVTGAKIKNNNMQKLIKCSVPLVLFVTLILCMSKNVEPYCDLPATTLMDKYNALSDASKDAVNNASPIRDNRMGFGPSIGVNNWKGSNCNNQSSLWTGSPLVAPVRFELPTGQSVDQSIADDCSLACKSKAMRDDSIAGDSNESVDYASGSDAAVCLQNLRNAIAIGTSDPVYTSENFYRADYLSRYINSSGEVTDAGRGPGLLDDVCKRMRDAPSAEDRECLGLDLPISPGSAGYEISCPGLSSAFETAVNNEYILDCNEAWSGCNIDCSRTPIDNYRGIGSCITQPACPAGEDACPSVPVVQDRDCEGTWTCDRNCVAQFTQRTAPSGSGRACPAAPTCRGGMGDCPRIVPGTVTFSHESLPIEGTTFTLYKMYVNLDTNVHRNMYALAFREPQDQFPRITKSVEVPYSGGSLTQAEITTINALILSGNGVGNATTIMNAAGGTAGLSSTENDALKNSSFITISEPNNPPSSASISSIGLNTLQWLSGEDILQGNSGTPTGAGAGGALFYMDPGSGPSPSDGRVFIGQLLIDQDDSNWSQENTLPVSFTAQGKNKNGSDWQAPVTSVIQNQTGEIQQSLELEVSGEVGDSLRRISCYIADGFTAGETCPANQGCGPIDSSVIQDVRDSTYTELYPDADFAEEILTGLQQSIADQFGIDMSSVVVDIPTEQIDCSQPITMP